MLQHAQVLIHVNTHVAVIVTIFPGSETDLLGLKDRSTIDRFLHFFVLWSDLLHLLPLLPCHLHRRDWARTLRERFGENLGSINKNAPGFPVA